MKEVRKEPKLVASGLFAGAFTIASWAAIWAFGLVFVDWQRSTSTEIGTAFLVLTAVSSGLNFLLAWLLVRFFGVEWGATISSVIMLILALIAGGAVGGFILFLLLLLPMFSALAAVERFSRAWRGADDAGALTK